MMVEFSWSVSDQLMQLHHYYRSSASYRVRIALRIKGIPWTSNDVNLGKGEHRTEAYGAIAPAKLVPTLVDGEFVVAQSLAIIEYLDEAYRGPQLIPSDIQDRAYVREIALDIGCEIHPLNNTRVLKQLEQLGIGEVERNAWYRQWVEIGLQVVESKVVRSKRAGSFCLADAPTVADCFLVPQIVNAKRFNCDLNPIPRLMGIFDACMALEAFSSTQPSALEPTTSA